MRPTFQEDTSGEMVEGAFCQVYGTAMRALQFLLSMHVSPFVAQPLQTYVGSGSAAQTRAIVEMREQAAALPPK